MRASQLAYHGCVLALVRRGFYAISISNPLFEEELIEAGYDYDHFQNASLAFCICGSLLWLPDLHGFLQRQKAAKENKRPAEGAKYISIAVMVLEDIPQLTLNVW